MLCFQSYVLISLAYYASLFDPCLFTKGCGSSFVALLVYVDDVIITSPSLDILADLNTSLHSAFTKKDLGDAKFFLGSEIVPGLHGTSLNHRKYLLEILFSHGHLCCKPTATPLSPGMILSQRTEDILQDLEMYRRLAGQLIYLNFRPDISHATQQLSQYVARPTIVHWNATIHILKYLKGCHSLGVFYTAHNTFQFKAYVDSDWVLVWTVENL